MTDVHTQDLVSWLKSLPKNHTVEWSDSHMDEKTPYGGSWHDIVIPEYEEINLTVNWAFTINLPDYPYEDEAREECSFSADPDVKIYAVWDKEKYWYTNEVVVPVESDLNLSDRVKLQKAAKEHDSEIHVRLGWTEKRLSDVLEAWTVIHAGRSDIKFKWNPNLPPGRMDRKLIKSIEF